MVAQLNYCLVGLIGGRNSDCKDKKDRMRNPLNKQKANRPEGAWFLRIKRSIFASQIVKRKDL